MCKEYMKLRIYYPIKARCITAYKKFGQNSSKFSLGKVLKQKCYIISKQYIPYILYSGGIHQKLNGKCEKRKSEIIKIDIFLYYMYTR